LRRNRIVAATIVCVLLCVASASYRSFGHRLTQCRHISNLLQGESSNQSVEQDLTAYEGLPDLRGRRAPNFNLIDLQGNRVSLADYRGKAVLINFWATWCGPCKVELPWLVAFRKQYAWQGFEILGIDVDSPQDREKVQPFSRRIGLDYPVLFGDDAVSRAYDCCQFLPTSYYIGRDGRIVEEAAGVGSREQIEANIRKALRGSAPQQQHGSPLRLAVLGGRENALNGADQTGG
jgi:peroxiredoxin